MEKLSCRHGLFGACGLCVDGRRAAAAEAELRETAAEVQRLREIPHGPPGAAAKESPKDIAAPGGATLWERVDSLERWRDTHTTALHFLSRRVELIERYLGQSALDYARSLGPEGHQAAPPNCPQCLMPMARYGGDGENGVTCVRCGVEVPDATEPADPCGCDATDALRAEVRDLRRCLTRLDTAGGLGLDVHQWIRKVLGPIREGDI